ncbi:MAG: ABC transporter substrate-binding protein [Desulfurococcaceae archaeon]
MSLLKLNQKYILSAVIVALIIIGMAAFLLLRGPTQPPQEGEIVIKIGFIFSLTGVASPIGPVQLRGALLAIDEIKNMNLEVDGKRIRIEYLVRDDATKSDEALARFRELKEWGAHFIIGTTFAAISAAINTELAKDPSLVFIPTNVLSLATLNASVVAPTLFAPHGTAFSIGYMGVKYLVEKMNVTRIAFFAPAYAFGWDQWKGAETALKEYGNRVSYMYIESPVGTPDFTPYFINILAWRPQALMIAHWGTDAINVLKQLYESGTKDKIPIIWFNWHTIVYDRGIPAGALSNVYGLISYYYNVSNLNIEETLKNKIHDFARKYWEKYGEYPDPYAAYAYLGVWIAIRGVIEAKSTDPIKISNVLLNMTFDTFKGEARFRIARDMLFPIGAFVVRGKSPTERANEWDLLEVIDVYSGIDYLPPLSLIGYHS